MKQAYSRKINYKIDHLFSAGIFTEKDAEHHRLKLVTAKSGLVENGQAVQFYWLIDPADGIIADAKFQAYGSELLIVLSEVACDMMVGKTYIQTHRITIETIEKHLRDYPNEPAYAPEKNLFLHIIPKAIVLAANQCLGIPLEQGPVTPIPASTQEGKTYPDWFEMNQEQRVAVIEDVLASEIRPYVEIDEGGIEIHQLRDYELIVAYKGACTSCFSSIGATLSSIQEILRDKVYSELVVTPHMEGLHL